MRNRIIILTILIAALLGVVIGTSIGALRDNYKPSTIDIDEIDIQDGNNKRQNFK